MSGPQLSDFFKPYSKSAKLQDTSCGVFAKVASNQIPKTLVWDITFRCNLKCIHCYNADKYGYGESSYGNGFTDLSTEQCKEILDNAKSSGILHVHFLGGEPLCRPDLPEIINYATKNGLCATLTSNGTLLTEDLSKKIISAGTEQVSISLDGALPTTNDMIRGKNSFERAIKGLKQLSEVKKAVNPSFEIGISFTMTKLSLNELPELIEIGRKNDVDVIVIENLLNLGIAEKHPELLYTYKEQIDSLENLGSYLLEHPLSGLRPTLQLDVSYALFRYMDRKYPIGFITPERTSICPALTNLIYLDSEGRFSPCGIAANLEYSPKRGNTEPIPTKDANNCSDLNLSHDAEFDKFLKIRENFSADKTPCPQCDYKGECLPCPVVEHSDKKQEYFSKCLEVFKCEREFEEAIVKSKVKLVDDSEKDMTKILPHSHFQISETGQYILNLLLESSEGESVQKIIDKLNETYNAPNPRVVERDVIDFIRYLSVNNIVELKNA